ncbi:DEAD/DEAH box helicase, partial [bacterium]|nr:DEAD/DEAH box helicase [bacterium]
GQYPVYLESGLVKLGELEEEFVYEARLGDNFQLGTNTWKIAAIEANRIIVRSAQGQPAKVPFWKGGIDGRDPELGRQIGVFSREFKQQLNSPTAAEWLQNECHLDPEAAANLTRFFQQQLQKGGLIPDDKTIVIESFRDEMGDPRVVLLSPYGRRVHYAWRLALVAEMRQRLNIELETIDSDSGILFRFSGVSPQAIIEIIQKTTSHHIMDLVTREIANSALFGLRFRYNAGRALLLPRQLPGKRTPLWLLRMRSRDLLEIVRQYDSFPIVVETYRELLQDFLALDELKAILSGIEKGSIQLKVVEKNFASPFCSALLFNFTAGYMYEYDTPKMSPQNAVTGISDEALADLLPQENIGHLLDYIVIDEMDSRLQGRYPGYQARSPQ